MKNNIGLVKYVNRAFEENWGYVYGTYGLVLTMAILEYKHKQYFKQIDKYYDFILNNYIGRRTADCVNLGKGYIWLNEETGVINYSKNEDYSADGMYNLADTKGDIKDMPDILGLAVHKDGHFGFYVGDNWVIEAKGTLYGVVKTPLFGDGATPWKHWCKMPFIEYIEDKTELDLNWVQIINKVTDSPTEWINAINAVVGIANSWNSLGVLNILKYFPLLLEKISRVQIKNLTNWNDIIFNTISSPSTEWMDAINTVINMAELQGDIGVLEIMKYVPELIVKVYKINN